MWHSHYTRNDKTPGMKTFRYLMIKIFDKGSHNPILNEFLADDDLKCLSNIEVSECINLKVSGFFDISFIRYRPGPTLQGEIV